MPLYRNRSVLCRMLRIRDALPERTAFHRRSKCRYCGAIHRNAYSTRLYMYIGIYNLYSDYRWLNNTAKTTPPRRTSQIIPGMVPVIAFWDLLFPYEYPMPISRYAYNPPNLYFLTHFWGIITRFCRIFDNFTLS